MHDPAHPSPPLMSQALAVADLPELTLPQMLRGDTVFAGYYKNDEATVQSSEGGWLHTGDLRSEK